jgi:chromosome segregation ATPase
VTLADCQSNTESLEALSGRHRTLQYEFERTQKALATSQAVQRRAELETAGWRSRVAELEKRVMIAEGKFREMREEASRGRKALEGVRIAAGVSIAC